VHDEDGDDGRTNLRMSPTGRVPQWVVDETARADSAAAAPAPTRPHRRFRWAALRGLVVLTMVLVLSLGAAVLAGPGPWPWEAREPEVVDAEPSVPPPPPPSADALPDRPAAGVEAAPSPRGVPLPPPPGGGSHAFVTFQTDGVTPVAYDPCRPVHYVIRPDSAPAGSEELVHEAVRRISEVTGLQFVYNGPTAEAPARDRALFQPEQYGSRWAPVLIAWETEEQNPALAGDVVGEAGSVPASLGNGPRVYLTGTVSLDAPRLGELLRGRGGRAVVRSIVLHELGHLMGLAHVEDEQQLMHPEARRDVPDFAAGDLTGLAALGSGPCVPDL
jgi:Matrixin